MRAAAVAPALHELPPPPPGRDGGTHRDTLAALLTVAAVRSVVAGGRLVGQPEALEAQHRAGLLLHRHLPHVHLQLLGRERGAPGRPQTVARAVGVGHRRRGRACALLDPSLARR